MKFKIGQVVITKRVNNEIAKSIEFSQFFIESIAKYRNCDWGNLPKDDKRMNHLAIQNNDDRIVARYNNKVGDIYIITEWDRSHTTILFTDEY